MPPTKPAHGVIATRPATAPDAAPKRGGVAAADPLEQQPPEHRGRGGHVRVHERLRGDAVGAERGAGVEPEPAEPQDAGAEQRERQRVRRHRVLRPAAPPADHQHDAKRGDAGVDVHDGAAGEVERAAPEQPARRREHPVRDRRVHDDEPDPEEPEPRRELHAVGDRAGDQRGRDDREHELERRERRAAGSATPPNPVAGTTLRRRASTRGRGCRSTCRCRGTRASRRRPPRGRSRGPCEKKFCISMASTFFARTMPP